ncbi:hypothetical protein LCGC14_3155810 [marine sediment metagenome]|uniref:Uncharacterized protein n=1 Tax=marine sediment metagenome TaxID=412755 RepID=A0A0F8XZK2_9ZZZZ
MRRENDYYPTPHSIINVLLSRWKPLSSVIWEPCAGDNRLVFKIDEILNPKAGVIISDIRDGVDFFDFKQTLAPTLITNPPFKHIRKFIDHAFAIGVMEMALVCPERLWACKKGREQFERHRPSIWANLDWREDYLGKGGSPDRALAIAIWNSPHSKTCDYQIWSRPNVLD